jgi:DNA repair exonuclease SbcCD ATPase subunit|tara:strand:- start:1384 stop:3162 length:1779 start_codon:yes stop_codon:yes gene_type:complete
MIKIKNITVKNFMSVGNQTQAIDFDKGELTLVLGENLDLGGDDSGSRNGTGKTTIVNALSYAIYGNALTNIKRDNLINKINGKGMLVSIEFEKNGIEYSIHRGRKPNILKFVVNGTEEEPTDHNEAQGDSRETQKAIEDLFGMSHDMFKHILALNTYTEPFLSMKNNDQRNIIEQLLGITMLSEKADGLKEKMRINRDATNAENTRIETVKASNERIQANIESLERKQKMWEDTKLSTITDLENGIAKLEKIDIEAEIEAHKCWENFNDKKRSLEEAQRWMANITADNQKQEKTIAKLDKEIADLKDHKCYACGQDLHDSKQDVILKDKEGLLQEAALHIVTNETKYAEHAKIVADIGELEACPTTQYDSVEEAYNHRNTVESLQKELEQKKAEENPYLEQIDDLKETAMQEVSFDELNELSKVKDHMDFLYKLLTNKDSFVRKKIIEQNLAYLNQRLTYYLAKVGLPHIVEFQNDLTVIITQLGQDLDFDNLSRGERNRLILSLSWAFRDVWESLYHGINLLFIDELVDSGMDSAGVESSISILKKMTRERNKNVFLISHRDDLAGRVNHVLKVIKENGFTSYSNDVEIVQ